MRLTDVVALSLESRSWNTIAPPASGVSWTACVRVSASRVRVPSAATFTMLCEADTAMSSPTGTAEVSWPPSSIRLLVLPVVASTLSTPVLPRSAVASWVSAAVSPMPQPGL